MNCDSCGYLTGDFISVHFMRSEDGCSRYKEGFFKGCSEYGEGLVDVISNIFMSRESMFFMCSNFISSSFVSIYVSIYNFSGSILPPNLLLTLIFSGRSSEDVVCV